jgi:hypothetical protein
LELPASDLAFFGHQGFVIGHFPGISSKPRQVESRGDLAHFRVGNLLGLAERLVRGGHNHVLEQLRVGRIERLRVNFDGGEGAVALGGDLDRAAAAGGLDGLAASWACTCSICCCMRAACFMSLPMLDILGML